MDTSLPADAVGPPADLWRRAVARGADVLTVFTAMWAMILVHVLWFVPSKSDDLQPEPWGRFFVATITFGVLAVLYEVVFLHWNKGQTPGRDWMKVRVVARDGSDPSLLAAAARAAAPGLAMLGSPLLLAGALLGALGAPALLGGRRRSIPDLLAGTTVVAWDRDAHEPPDPRAHRRRPRSLRMLAGMTRDPDGPSRWVATEHPDRPGHTDHPGSPEPHTRSRRTPALSGQGKRRAQ